MLDLQRDTRERGEGPLKNIGFVNTLFVLGSFNRAKTMTKWTT